MPTDAHRATNTAEKPSTKARPWRKATIRRLREALRRRADHVADVGRDERQAARRGERDDARHEGDDRMPISAIDQLGWARRRRGAGRRRGRGTAVARRRGRGCRIESGMCVEGARRLRVGSDGDDRGPLHAHPTRSGGFLPKYMSRGRSARRRSSDRSRGPLRHDCLGAASSRRGCTRPRPRRAGPPRSSVRSRGPSGASERDRRVVAGGVVQVGQRAHRGDVARVGGRASP